MHKKPIYYFENGNSTAVTEVPVLSLLAIGDTTGIPDFDDQPVVILLLAKSGMSAASTISQFIAVRSNWMYLYNGDMFHRFDEYVLKIGDTMTGKLKIDADLEVRDHAIFNGRTDLNGHTYINGALDVNSTAHFHGATTVSGSLATQGAVDFYVRPHSHDGMLIDGTTTTDWAVVSNGLTVGTNATVGGYLSVNGNITTNSSLVVGDDATIADRLTVQGVATFNGTVNSNTQLNANNVDVNGSFEHHGSLATFDHNVDVDGTLTANGAFNVDGGMTSHGSGNVWHITASGGIKLNTYEVLTEDTGVMFDDFALPNKGGIIKAKRVGNTLYMSTGADIP